MANYNNKILLEIKGIDKFSSTLRQLSSELSKLTKQAVAFNNAFAKSFKTTNLTNGVRKASEIRNKIYSKETATLRSQLSKRYQIIRNVLGKINKTSNITASDLGKIGRNLQIIRDKSTNLPSLDRQLNTAKLEKFTADFAKTREKLNAKKIVVPVEPKVDFTQIKKELSLLRTKVSTSLNEGFNNIHSPFAFMNVMKIKKSIGDYRLALEKARKAGVISIEDQEKALIPLRSKFKSLRDIVVDSGNVLVSWWRRFGEVAFGFGLIYRAITFVQGAIDNLIGVIKQGIASFDTFNESVYKSAMFLGLFAKVKFPEAVRYATGQVNAFILNATDAMSSIDELTGSMDELAQHGVFVSSASMRQLVNFTDLVAMISKTTGSVSIQVRQEFESLFQGVMRPGNITLRFLKNLLSTKDWNKLIQSIKNGTNATQRFENIFKLLAPRMNNIKEKLKQMDFSYDVTILKNQIMLVTNYAMRMSAVMQKLKNKNTNIFANALQTALKGTGFEYLDKIRKTLNDIAKVKASGMGDLSKLVSQYNSEVKKLSGSELGGFIGNLSLLLNNLSVAMGWLIKKAIWGAKAFFTFINVLRNVYNMNKPLIDVFATLTLTFIKARVALFAIMFPIKQFVYFYKVGGSLVLALAGAFSFLKVQLLNILPLTRTIGKVIVKGLTAIGVSAKSAIAFLGGFSASTIAVIGSLSLLAVALYSVFNWQKVSPFANDFKNHWILFWQKRFKDVLQITEGIEEIFHLPVDPITKSLLGNTQSIIKDYKERVKSENPLKDFKIASEPIINAVTKASKDIYGKLSPVFASLQDKLFKKLGLKLTDTQRKEMEKSFNETWKKILTDTINSAGKIPYFNNKSTEATKKSLKDLTQSYTSALESIRSGYKSLYDWFTQHNVTSISTPLGIITKSDMAKNVVDYFDKQMNLIKKQLNYNPFKPLQKYYSDFYSWIKGKNIFSPLEMVNKLNPFNQILPNIKNQSSLVKQNMVETLSNLSQGEIDALDKVKKKIEYLKLYLQAQKFKVDFKLSKTTYATFNKLQEKIQETKKLLSSPADMAKGYNQLLLERKQLESMLNDMLKVENVKKYDPEAVKNLKNELKDVNDQISKINKNTDTSWKMFDFLKKYKDKVFLLTQYTKTVTQQTQDVINGFLNTTSDVLYDAMTGKLKSFKDYVMGIIQIIDKAVANMLAQRIVGQILNIAVSAFTPSSNLGFLGDTTNSLYGRIPFVPHANGGIVNQPTLFPMANGGIGLMGEAGAEAIMPLARNNRGELGVKAQANNQPQNVHLNIVNTVDPQLVGDYLSSPNGANTVLNIIQSHSYQVRKILNF